MRVPWEWLSEHVELSGLAPEDVAERLTLAGLEVEGLHRVGSELAGLVTARVVAVAPHPNADRLRLVTAAVGGEAVTVVCGAPNVAEGQTVVLARAGASLPSGRLKASKIRGIRSEGMILSEGELGLPETVDGIWVLEDGVEPGLDAVAALGLADTVIELSLTPNRPDCLSVHGVAREVAALVGRPLRPLVAPDLAELEAGGVDVSSRAEVVLEDPAGCPRYTGRVLEGLSVRPSPWWMRRRLHAAGMRPISNLVDVTNYVLMEWGQPLHAFDLDVLEGRRIVVRRARAGERLTTLDGVDRALEPQDVVIADAERPVALAGVMGGLASEVRQGTERLLLESAHFDPASVRRTAHRHGLHSEASHRFERGVDPAMPGDASARAAQLLVQTGGGQLCRGLIDRCPEPVRPRRIVVSVPRINGLLGTALSAEEVAATLSSIEVQTTPVGDESLQVTVPTWRPDLEREVDVAEEVARLFGYDRIEAVLPTAPLGGGHAARTLPLPEGLPEAEGRALPSPGERARLRSARRTLAAAGIAEHYSVPLVAKAALETLFSDPDDPRRRPVELQNPLSEEHSVLRTSLLPGLLEALRENARHGHPDVRLFEVGRVFLPRDGGGLPDERVHLGVAFSGGTPQTWSDRGRELDLFDLKGAIEALVAATGAAARVEPARAGTTPYLHPGAAAELWIGEEGGKPAGVLGELHPDLRGAWDLHDRVFVAELALGSLPAPDRLDKSFSGLPRFPSVVRDGALVVDELVLAGRVLETVRRHAATRAGRLVDDVEVFDVYRGESIGEGRKSLAIKVRYAAPDRTLTDEEVNAAHGALVALLEGELGAEVRS